MIGGGGGGAAAGAAAAAAAAVQRRGKADVEGENGFAGQRAVLRRSQPHQQRRIQQGRDFDAARKKKEGPPLRRPVSTTSRWTTSRHRAPQPAAATTTAARPRAAPGARTRRAVGPVGRRDVPGGGGAHRGARRSWPRPTGHALKDEQRRKRAKQSRWRSAGVHRRARSGAEAAPGATQESHARRALHNKLLELEGNIRVFCRVRPGSAAEQEAGLVRNDAVGSGAIDLHNDGQSVTVTLPKSAGVDSPSGAAAAAAAALAAGSSSSSGSGSVSFSEMEAMTAVRRRPSSSTGASARRPRSARSSTSA